jgi:hypothetical protein
MMGAVIDAGKFAGMKQFKNGGSKSGAKFTIKFNCFVVRPGISSMAEGG